VYAVIGLTVLLVAGLVVATPPASAPPSSTFTATGPLTLDPSVAPGNVVVTISGQTTPGVRPCALILDKTETGACIVTDTGAVSGQLTVPAGTAPLSTHVVIACVGACKVGALAFISPRQLLAAPLTVPDPLANPLLRPVQAPGHASVTGGGFSPGGQCRLTAGKIAARCDVDARGGLRGSMPVTAVTPTGSYRIAVTNVGPGFSQRDSVPLNVIGRPTPTHRPTALQVSSRGPSSSPSSGPSSSAQPSLTPTGSGGHGHNRWSTVAAWGGGIGGGGILLGGAAFSTLRWRRRPRTLPAVKVTVRARPMLRPRLVEVHSSHLHAVHLRLRTVGVTLFDPPRREE
jgi:hypothetical protein